MEKTRVNKGYKYWYLDEYLQAIDTYEENSKLDDKLWEIGNYHNSEEKALEVAKLVRAVFNGAEVVEMPSEEEIQKVLAEKIPIHGGRTYGEALNCCWFEEGIHWLRDNKIVK